MAGAGDNDMPDLPEEWGVIVIPDDLAELSDEVEVIRAELRQEERADRWRRFFDRRGLRRVRRAALAVLRAPVLIISMAVLVTVASLVASAWPGPSRQQTAQPNSGSRKLSALPHLSLVDETGKTFELSTISKPAVVLVTDRCDTAQAQCDQLVAATIAATMSRKLSVIVIGPSLAAEPTPGSSTPATQSTPPPTTSGQIIRRLHEKAGGSADVRNQLEIGLGSGTAAALLVDKNGQVVRVFNSTLKVDDFQPSISLI